MGARADEPIEGALSREESRIASGVKACTGPRDTREIEEVRALAAERR